MRKVIFNRAGGEICITVMEARPSKSPEENETRFRRTPMEKGATLDCLLNTTWLFISQSRDIERKLSRIVPKGNSLLFDLITEKIAQS